MGRRKPIPSVSLSMMDLISNALAGVIILFFILSSARYPSFPPERVCGTLLVEFSFARNLIIPFDSTKTWLQYSAEPGKALEDAPKGPAFENDITHFNQVIMTKAQQSRCLDSGLARKSFDSIPALNTYEYVGKDSVKQIIIMHDPPEGYWDLGILYSAHLNILAGDQRRPLKVKVTFVGEKNLFVVSCNDYVLVAPTSMVFAKVHFNLKQALGGNDVKIINAIK